MSNEEQTTWYYHITPSGDVHKGQSKDCFSCRKRKKSQTKSEAKSDGRKGGKTRDRRHKRQLQKCVASGCNHEIRKNQTGLCAPCYKEARAAACLVANGGDPSNGLCSYPGCSAKLGEKNTSGYCGDHFNTVAKWTRYFKKHGDLKKFGF